MNRFVFPMVIILVGFGLAGALIATGPKLEPRPKTVLAPLVRVVEVHPGLVKLSTITHGTVVPRTESELVPEVAGRIIEISNSMVSGGFFKKGDVLIRIDPLDYEVTLRQMRAGLTRATSDLTNARTAHQRQLDLASNQSTSASQRDDALNRLRNAEATLDEAKAKLSRAERDILRTQLIAPYDGRVRSERVDVGQFVSRGTAVAMIYAIDSAEVRLPIHDDELAYLDLSLSEAKQDDVPVLVTLRAKFAGKRHEWQGQVVRTEGELDPQTRMINIVASVNAPYQQLDDKPPLSVGLFVEAEIHGSEVDNIVILPRSALRDNQQVYIVDSLGKLRFRDVEIFRIANDQIYISQGLSAGDRVCLSPLDSALDGMAVRLYIDQEVADS